ncbi:hypothetical protein PRK78_006632 [Emydomyces testavorans]|uniref:Uncharacterized protein n=1 Tax=Emydomyces testavorans TaxID=2070801 RepID=A0AAF0DM41_9EURO|nr:hypothetical protein PRK78_006632 [Emydomyces testavorans]
MPPMNHQDLLQIIPLRLYLFGPEQPEKAKKALKASRREINKAQAIHKLNGQILGKYVMEG